jgi:predicted nucleic acid-binding protein
MPLADSNIWLALALSKHQFHAAARTWLAKLRDRKILVRWFSTPEVRDYLRQFLRHDWI